MFVKQLHTFIVVLMTLLVSATPLFAQALSVDKAPEQGRGLSMFLAFILATAIIVASVWGSRRGHQD